MKLRCIIGLSLGLALLVPPVEVKAENQPITIIVEDDYIGGNAEHIELTSENTTVIIGETVVNGTILRNKNLERGSPFMPKIEELPFLESLIIKDTAGKLAVMYAGEYNLPLLELDDPISREYKILGGDALLTEEQGGEYVYAFDDGKLSTYESVTMMYKALGTNRYKLEYSFEAEEANITNSPLVELVPIQNVIFNKDYYYTNVYVSRTLPEEYWKQAIQGRIVSGIKKEEEITLGEFCTLLSRLLIKEGETTLNKEETAMLLVSLGKTLPHYLKSEELEAVKYLLARGIIEDDLDYGIAITQDVALSILMRAKDKNSRLDFKVVNVPYIEELVDKGYYPTRLHMQESPMQGLTVKSEKVVSDYYDYYVRIMDGTRFKDASNWTEIDDLYISNKPGDTSVRPYRGSKYLGREGDYYHFQVPIDVLNSTAIEDGYITINTRNGSDLPHNIQLEYGGGRYNSISDGRMRRQEFHSEDSVTLNTIDRKRVAVENNTMKRFLSAVEQETEFVFEAEEKELNKLLWDGEPIKDSPNLTDIGEGKYSLKVLASDPYRAVIRYLSYASPPKENETVEAYVVEGRSALVSASWLKRQGLITNVVEMAEGKSWIIYSDEENVLIDLANRLIVSGQVVTEIPEGDPSPLIIADTATGEVLIDYRAINNVSPDYLIIKDSDGNITLSIDKEKRKTFTKRKNYPIVNLMGSIDSLPIRGADKRMVDIEATYEKGNYLIYKERSSPVQKDYLIVMRPSLKSMSKVSQEELVEKFNLKISANVAVRFWEIGRKVRSLEARDRVSLSISLNKSGRYIKNGKLLTEDESGIFFDTELRKYYYKVPEVEDINKVYNNYIQGIDDYPIPYVMYEGKVVDMNINIINSDFDITKYPSTLQNRTIGTRIFKGSPITRLDNMLPAVCGVHSQYYPYPDKGWNSMYSEANLYYGTMPVTINIEENDVYTEVIKMTSSMDTNLVLEHTPTEWRDVKEKPFVETFRGRVESVYVYGLKDMFKSTNIADIESKNEWKQYLYSNKLHIAMPDWDELLRGRQLGVIGTIIDFSMILFINIVPRVMIFVFLAFATLSLIADHKLLNIFADKVVDPFKLLSLGLCSIEQVTAFKAWVSVSIGIALLALINNESLMKLFGWLMRGLSGILD